MMASNTDFNDGARQGYRIRRHWLSRPARRPVHPIADSASCKLSCAPTLAAFSEQLLPSLKSNYELASAELSWTRLPPRHLRQLLFLYMDYYNKARTHLSLNKDAPVPRALQAVGRIHASPIL